MSFLLTNYCYIVSVAYIDNYPFDWCDINLGIDNDEWGYNTNSIQQTEEYGFNDLILFKTFLLLCI
jgi:hypothetical protein